MLSKNNIKFINSLRQKKFRQIHQQFIVEGEKLVKEALFSGFNINQLIATENGLNSLVNDNRINKYDFNVVNEKELNKISTLTTPNKALAVISIPERNFANFNFNEGLILGFEEINDPGNLGTIIRTADWFGIKSIICSNNSVDVYNPKVVQATMGAVFRVNVYYCDLNEIVNINKSKLIVYGTFMEGKNVLKEKIPENSLILFGNESKGLSNKLASLVDHKITIPTYSKNDNRTESLNISIAVSVICAHLRNN